MINLFLGVWPPGRHAISLPEAINCKHGENSKIKMEVVPTEFNSASASVLQAKSFTTKFHICTVQHLDLLVEEHQHRTKINSQEVSHPYLYLFRHESRMQGSLTCQLHFPPLKPCRINPGPDSAHFGVIVWGYERANVDKLDKGESILDKPYHYVANFYRVSAEELETL